MPEQSGKYVVVADREIFVRNGETVQDALKREYAEVAEAPSNVPSFTTHKAASSLFAERVGTDTDKGPWRSAGATDEEVHHAPHNSVAERNQNLRMAHQQLSALGFKADGDATYKNFGAGPTRHEVRLQSYSKGKNIKANVTVVTSAFKRSGHTTVEFHNGKDD